MATTGPRIYNLFPTLIGPVREWAGHLSRIQGMGFDWVYLNPIHYPGFSGSLYAVKDPYRLHDLFQGGEQAHPDELVRRFVRDAGRHGQAVMLDVVINHTSKDALLVGEHPEWFRRDGNGELYSPRAVDPNDPAKVTVWGDLAELDYGRAEARAGLIEYWSRYLRHYTGLGVKGFRCDAAYQVPADVWKPLIDAARQVDPEVTFFAETLGCTVDQVRDLCGAGFDFLFNSSKWWDFKSDWLLEQYDVYRWIAPTIGFPESHDTDRLAAEVGSQDTVRLAAQLKMHYLFAACFSTGVMMPVGFEYGFTRKLDVVNTRPEDWEQPKLDLTGFIGRVNAMKAAIPALNVEGPQRRVTAPHNPVVGLVRTADGAGASGADGGCSVLVVNPDENSAHAIDPGPLLAQTGGIFGGFDDVTPEAEPIPFEPGANLVLKPLELRVFRARAEQSRPIEVRGHDPDATAQQMMDELAARRVTIENVYPEIDSGRFPVRRAVGDAMDVWADIFTDGTFVLGAEVKYKAVDEAEWRAAPMRFVENDRWTGRVPLTRNTRYVYTIEAWRDVWESWRADFVKKHDAGLDVSLELVEGRRFVEQSAALAHDEGRAMLQQIIDRMNALQGDELIHYALSEGPRHAMHKFGERQYHSRYGCELEVWVDRTAARYSAWFEIFPRSASPDPGRPGTFDDVVNMLPFVRDMGFDVLYFPPIHPIGRSFRKGRNNTLNPGPDDPGVPYAIGAEEGGHDAIDPMIGDFEGFRRLVKAAEHHGLEIALDFAVQCSPDHPWIKQHPEWFYWRPDGTIRYAENPPKKYQDIVNVSFYRGAYPDLWYALRDVVLFWCDQGVRIFRVDNPHTKPFPFWEWLIHEVRERHPGAIFLAEAFTRPKLMRRLAKIGFQQSYSYFTWRNTKHELTEYLTELTQGESKDYMLPNFFANTPDILPPILVHGGRPAHMMRAVLAATLSPSYGLYGPYLVCEADPYPGKEEYNHSEKYEVRHWDYTVPGNIVDYVTRINRIRRENPALHQFTNLRFYGAHDDNILLYGKMTESKDNVILIAVNLDPHHGHGGTIEVPLWELGLPDGAHVDVEDLFSGHRFTWIGKYQHVWLDPHQNPAAIWRLRKPGV
ncbi:maltotransferase domain-containing protein [Azospirillum sp.]|uniref:maltotransferase domain-containing protein n=1 Tax=Azospirillum sp. TaxID=34012 RepID=UPI002D72C727|nr:maltotransferase domain-containing protein [Azospirillum sp.]HYD67702.1 maltotransferase domain-containing protein [Azospirillum sp.]